MYPHSIEFHWTQTRLEFLSKASFTASKVAKKTKKMPLCCCSVLRVLCHLTFFKDVSGSPRGRSSNVKRVLNCSKKGISPMKWSIIDMNKNQSIQTVLNRLIKPNGNHFFLNFSFIIININILIHDIMDSWLFFFFTLKERFFQGEGNIRIFCWNWKIKFVVNIKHKTKISGCDIVNYRRVRFWHVQLRHAYSTDC